MAGTGYEVGPGGGFEFTPYAAGPRRYGMERSTTATSGPISDTSGYDERELRRRARLKAIQGRIAPTTTTPAVPSQVLSGMGQWR